MRKSPGLLLPACAVVLLVVAAEAFGGGASGRSAPPELAMMLSRPGAQSSRLVFTGSDATASLSHPPYAVVKGRTLPGTRVALVVADTWARERDGTFGAALLRMTPGEAPVTLASRVVHATRPLVTAEGRVFVERGEYGPEPTFDEARAGALRTDQLRVDEINPVTGEARTVHAFAGYTTHLAGALGGELFLYRVDALHADLVAVDLDSGAVRTLAASIPPYARDFSVDARRAALVFTDARAGEVIALDLRSGARRVLASDPTNEAFAPFAWPDGKVAWNDGAGGFAVGGEVLEPLGGGTALVRAVSGDGKWIAVDRTRPSRLPEPFIVSSELRAVLRVPLDADVRADVIGFVDAEASR